MRKAPPNIKDVDFSIKFAALKKSIESNKSRYDEKILELSNGIQSIESVPMIQSELYVVLHDIGDNILATEFSLIRIEHKLDVYKKQMLIFYKTESDISLNSFSEITTTLNGDCASYQTSIKIIKSYLAYLNECRKLLNSLTFAIKNRIELLKINSY